MDVEHVQHTGRILPPYLRSGCRQPPVLLQWPLEPALHHDVIMTQLLPATNWDVMLSTQLAGALETP